MKAYSTHYQHFTIPHFKGIVCLFTALMLTVVDMKGEVNIGEEYTWNSSSKTLTIHKAGDFADGIIGDYGITTDKPKWKDAYSNEAIKIIIADGIKTIGTQNFNNFTKLEKIVLPASLATIKQGAFASCNALKEVLFKGSPNEWASIDFQSSDEYYRSHPFTASSAETRKFAFFYTSGEAPATVNLVMTSALSEIKPYAFYRATNVDYVYLPGTITSIGKHGLDCKIKSALVINKPHTPILGTTAITFNSTSTKLQLRSDAVGFSGSPWNGATKSTLPVSGNKIPASTGANVTWNLDSLGTLTINAIGSDKTLSIPSANETNYPWYNFRRSVNKIVIKGDMTDVNNLLKWHYALAEVEIDQSIIPNISQIASNYSNSYENLFDRQAKVIVRLLPSTIENSSEISKLSSESWNYENHLKKGILRTIILEDNTDNNTLLNKVHDYIELPFEVEFGRTLTNAQYNTFCSPVPMSAEQITAAFGGADIRALEGSEYNAETKELTLNFSESSLTEIEAGKPYLIKPMNETVNPHFANIAPGDIKTTPIDATTEFVDFKGVLAPTALTGGNKNTLFLGAGNELFWPESTGNLNGFRAYFEIKDASAQAAKRARISMGGKIATGIENPSPTLPSREGVKILRDGKLYLMYKGQMYDVQGRRM